MAVSIAYNMDCMEYMRTLPDKAFDLAVVDPPYGIGIHNMDYCRSGAKKSGKATRRDYSNTGVWDVAPSGNYFNELFRVSANQIIWGGNYFDLPRTKSWIVWDKRLDDKFSNDFADCELAWVSVGVARVFRYMWSGFLQGDMKNKEDRFHPTQKPVALYAWIFSHYAKPGDKILDTHLGSGSSRIAAYDAGLDFVGCEIDPDYFEAQEARFQAHAAQGNLFLEEELING